MWTGIIGLILGMLQSAPACSWVKPAAAGTLPAVINESSGLAISRRLPNRAYRINDSGDSGRFFVTGLTGEDIRVVNVAGFQPRDVEGIAVGPCGSTDCLFIADIGDNSRARRNLEIVIIEERREFSSEVRPAYRVQVQYPDGPHDAEALGVHPDGTVYIVTKDPAGPLIYRLKRSQWLKPADSVETLERVTALDLAKMLPVSTVIDRFVTSMDIAPDGKKAIILTYRNAVELLLDLSAPIPDAGSWKAGVHYRQVDLEVLEQQEAVAYLPDGITFLYDTERPNPSRPARIMRVACTR